MLYLYLRFQIFQQQAASSKYTYELKYQEFHREIWNGEVILWYKWLDYMKAFRFLLYLEGIYFVVTYTEIDLATKSNLWLSLEHSLLSCVKR